LTWLIFSALISCVQSFAFASYATAFHPSSFFTLLRSGSVSSLTFFETLARPFAYPCRFSREICFVVCFPPSIDDPQCLSSFLLSLIYFPCGRSHCFSVGFFLFKTAPPEIAKAFTRNCHDYMPKSRSFIFFFLIKNPRRALFWVEALSYVNFPARTLNHPTFPPFLFPVVSLLTSELSVFPRVHPDGDDFFLF